MGEYLNIREDANMLWGILKARLSDGITALDVRLIADTLLTGIEGLSAYFDETDHVEKRRYALALIDEIYETEIRPLRLMPEGRNEMMSKVWDITEDALDVALGVMIHRAADGILDRMLKDY